MVRYHAGDGQGPFTPMAQETTDRPITAPEAAGNGGRAARPALMRHRRRGEIPGARRTGCLIRTQTHLRPAALLAALALHACAPAAPESHAVGMLEWERVELTAEVSEPIVALAVSEGDEVAAGDVIAQLDAARALARIEEARAARDEARARLSELEHGPRHERISEARARLTGAEQILQVRVRELRRLGDLAARDLASAEDVDRARAIRDAARADRDAARALLAELEAGTRRERVEQAAHALARAEAILQRLYIDRDRLMLRAPRPALVDSLLFEEGERPRAGEVVAVLLDGTRRYARVYVPEPIRVHVRPGDPAEIFVDGLGSGLAGRVRTVAREATFTPYFALTEHDRGRLSYVAEVDLVGGEAALPAGVPVEVRFPRAARVAAK